MTSRLKNFIQIKTLKNEIQKLGILGSIWLRITNEDCRHTVHVHPCGKQIKYIKAAPTFFGSLRNHHQGAKVSA